MEYPFYAADPFADFQAAVPAGQPEQAVTPASFYDRQVAAVKANLAQYEGQINALAAQIAGLEITGADTERQALDLGQTSDKLWKAIEARRKEFVEEPNAYVKSINGLAKHYQERLDAARRDAKAKLGVYLAAKALEAQKAAEAERRARAEMQAKLDAEAARLTAEAKARDEAAPAVTAPKLPDAPPAVAPNTIRSAEGSATMIKSWQFEIIDPAAVPREYLMVDEKAVRQAVKDGIREIPGVRVFEDSNIRFGQ